MYEEKIAHTHTLMNEWGLTCKEKAQLLPENPTEKDCDNIELLRLTFSFNRKSIEWLRTPLKDLKGMTPLEYVNGNPHNLVRVIKQDFGPT